MSVIPDDSFNVTPHDDSVTPPPDSTAKIIPLPAAGRPLDELLAAARRAGWLEGYAASEQDQVQRTLVKPELADQILLGRVGQILAQLRELAEVER